MQDISIIIPSIGGEILIKTITQLNAGTIVPNEIIVVVPLDFANRIPNYSSPNLHFEIVNFKGQVAQRAHGFKIAKCNFVLQLDDDVFLDKFCIERLLVALISLGTGHCVGPSFFYEGTKTSVYSRFIGFNGFINNVKTFFAGSKWGAKRMGTISKNGTGFGLDFYSSFEELNQVEWLAGGCILHFKSNLLLDNFFPFAGKAYGEDLIHSVLLRFDNIRLYNVKNAFCYIEQPVINESNYSLEADYNSRLYLNKLRKLSLFYTHLWYIIRFFVNKYCL